ncbi:1-phosphofructokinase [Herpetosiphon gulosus]|uniref:1-phosphofructokinase n=1 Tax=Herpetosiphon gulosus TaxID=1973496 RepID=A0ABP9X468_9CHLR
MSIVTLTLNPAIDQTIFINNFQLETVNRAYDLKSHAGGKGVNVASLLAANGHKVVATGFLGDQNTELFDKLFAEKQIDDQFIRIPGQPRVGIKISDQQTQRTTEINLPGLTPTNEQLDAIRATIKRLAADDNQWFILAGNVPPGIPSTIYGQLIEIIRAAGKQVVLDTSGEALRYGLAAAPTIAKPNLAELEQFVGYPLTSEQAAAKAGRELLSHGIKLVVISMGEHGALFLDNAQSLVAIPPSVAVQSTVGAGDAMVSGLVAAQTQGLDLVASARLATAFAAAKITQLGSNLPAAEIVEHIRADVVIRPCNAQLDVLQRGANQLKGVPL